MWGVRGPFPLLTAMVRRLLCLFCGVLDHKPLLPGGTLVYPAQPRLISLSVCESVCGISFTYSAENLLIPTIKASSRPLGIDTVGYPAQPQLMF